MPTDWICNIATLPPELTSLGIDVTAFRKTGGAGYARIEPAASDVVLIVGAGTPWKVAGPSEALGSYQAFAAGLAMQPYEVTSVDPIGCIEIRLPPTVARELFRTTLVQTDGVVDLAELLGQESVPLIEKVAAARDPRALMTDVVRMLASRLADCVLRTKPEICWAWRRIVQTRGRTSIRALADEIGWSERHFAVLFRNHIGLAPKAAARLARFSAAYRRVAESGDALAAIAIDTGYSDQSHMSREFKALAGGTPAAVRQSVGADVVIRQDPFRFEVGFLQDYP